LVGLVFELRALHLQSRYSTTRATLPVHFSLVILEMGSPRLALNSDPSDFSLPSSWGYMHEAPVPSLVLNFRCNSGNVLPPLRPNTLGIGFDFGYDFENTLHPVGYPPHLARWFPSCALVRPVHHSIQQLLLGQGPPGYHDSW
jgi:hypothetical protein